MKPITTVQATAAVLLLGYALVGPNVPGVSPPPPAPPLAVPSAALAAKVRDVAKALAAAPLGDRLVWAEVWSKAGKTIALESPITGEPLFTDAKSLRAFTIAALEIGWHRINGVEPGRYPNLREAVEEFLKDPAVLGRDDVSADAAMRTQYGEACHAIAWAGLGRG
jgi:hypothetical protein